MSRPMPQAALELLGKLIDENVLAWLVAIEFRTGDAFYLTSNNEPVTYGGQTWTPYPMRLEKFRDSGEGDLPTIPLTLSNVGGAAMPYLESGEWDRADVTFTVVNASDPSRPVPLQFVYTARGATATSKSVTFSLGVPQWREAPLLTRTYRRSDGFPGIKRNPN